MGLKQNRLDRLMGQYSIGEDAVKAIVEGLSQVQRALGTAGVEHKQMEDETTVTDETPVVEDEPETARKADAEELAAMVLEVMAEELGADSVPDFAPELAAAIGRRIAEYVGMMAEEEMQANMTEDQQKGLDQFRLDYEQREKMVTLLDQLVQDTGDDGQAITEIADAIKELQPLVKRFAAVEKTVGDMAKQLSLRPRRASEADETRIEPTEQMVEDAKEADEELVETRLGLKLRKGWKAGAQE